MEFKPRTILFFGPQGAGKGTQKEEIASWLQQTTSIAMRQIELGDFFRRLMQTEGHTQSLVKEIQNTGKLQPDFLAIHAVVEAMIASFSGHEHLMLDGFPRNELQVIIMQQIVGFYGLEVDVVVLELSEEESIRRLSMRGREDDTPEAIRERLSLYRAETQPLLDHFYSNGQYRVHRIDGQQAIPEVTESIINALSATQHD